MDRDAMLGGRVGGVEVDGVALSRRRILTTALGATAVGGLLAGKASARELGTPGMVARGTPHTGELRVGVIGCGGRGTGAAVNMLEASEKTRIVALGDALPDRLATSREELLKLEEGLIERVDVPTERCFVGFDAYEKVLAAGVDVVILATPPHFRPMHLAAAVAAGKHVFMEKPVAVDAPGVRMVLEAASAAKARGLSIATGTQRRHERSYLEAMAKLREGAIGRVSAATCSWNQGSLWHKEREASWSDMEWQLRNWLYFTWLAGDHIVEQHMHNIDAVLWGLGAAAGADGGGGGDMLPVSCFSLGGRQVRTQPVFGNVFDHFATVYEFRGGITVTSTCRQIEGTQPRVEEAFYGSKGVLMTQSGRAVIVRDGEEIWKFQGENPNPYVEEHKALFEAITTGRVLDEASVTARSTLAAIMGRMAAYTGKQVSWDEAMASVQRLGPERYEFGELPVDPVAVPGVTALV